MKKLFIALIVLSLLSTVTLFAILKLKVGAKAPVIEAHETQPTHESSENHADGHAAESADHESKGESHSSVESHGEPMHEKSGHAEAKSEASAPTEESKDHAESSHETAHSQGETPKSAANSKAKETQIFEKTHDDSKVNADHDTHETHVTAPKIENKKTSKPIAKKEFYIQVKALNSSEAGANEKAESMKQKLENSLGLDSRLCKVSKSGTEWIRVQAGPFDTANEAKDFLPEIKSLGFDSGTPFIVKGVESCH